MRRLHDFLSLLSRNLTQTLQSLLFRLRVIIRIVSLCLSTLFQCMQSCFVAVSIVWNAKAPKISCVFVATRLCSYILMSVATHPCVHIWKIVKRTVILLFWEIIGVWQYLWLLFLFMMVHSCKHIRALLLKWSCFIPSLVDVFQVSVGMT